MVLIAKEDIPHELWHNGTLRMPSILVEPFRSLLNEYKIMDKAVDLNNPRGVKGGKTLEETLEYLARRFGVSSSRIESLLLDPNRAFFTISSDLLTLFSEGKIAVLDIACGIGSVGASILSTICTLRKEGILPKTPTSVRIIGGDCSPHALDIYEKMMKGIVQDLEATGISSQLETVNWLAESSYTTAVLFDQLYDKYPDADEYLVFIANFSGALDSHFEEYKNSIQHIFDRAYGKCTIIWIEPGGYSKAERLFKRIKKLVDFTPWRDSKQIGPVSYDYKWFHPFQNRSLPCRVLLKAYDHR